MGLGLTGYIPLAVYLLSLGLALLAAFKDRRLAIFYFLPLLPLTSVFLKMHDYPMGKDIVDIMIAAIVVGWVVQNRAFVRTPANPVLYAFAILTFLSLLNGYGYIGEGFNIGDLRTQMWKNYMTLPLIFFIVVNNIKTMDEVKKLVLYLSLIYLVIALKFFKGYSDPGYFTWTSKQDFGVFAYLGANFMAAFMVQYLAVFLALFYYTTEWKSRLYFLAITGFGAYNVMYLFSRGSYLAFAVIMTVIGVFKDRRILAGLVVLVMFWNYLLPTSVFQRINMTLNAEDTLGGDSVGRGVLWEHALGVFAEHPFVGTGYRTFEHTISDEMRQHLKENIGRELKDTHSLYFNVMAEMGMTGLGVLLFLFILAARSGLLLFMRAEDGFLKGLGLGFFLCVIAAMVTNAFGDSWSPITTQAYYWIFWGLCERGHILIRQQKPFEAAPEKARLSSAANTFAG